MGYHLRYYLIFMYGYGMCLYLIIQYLGKVMDSLFNSLLNWFNPL